MAISNDEGYSQRVLMVGDSRLKRLRNIPCAAVPLHSIDFSIINGITILDLIEKVDEQLAPEHVTLILMGFLGDSTCLVPYQLTDNSTVSLVSHHPGHPATHVLELAAIAHARWQTARTDRKIIWTIPYYLDIVTYNSFRFLSPLSLELRTQSIKTSQAFVHFVDQLLSKWNNLMPKNAFYRPLNDVMFHGRSGRDLLKTFNFRGEHFVFPEHALLDGIHPSPGFTDMLWKCLVRATKTPSQIQFNPVPALAQLTMKERLWHSTSDLPHSTPKAPKWKGKGKGKGKNSNPYNVDSRNKVIHSPQNYYPQNITPYAPDQYNQYGAYPSSYSSQPNYAHTPLAPAAPYYPSTSQPPPTPSAPPATSYTPLPAQSSSEKNPNEELLEETGYSYGNLSWRPLPAEPLALGVINYSCPQAWSWESHLAEVSRIQGRCMTNSIAQQNIFKEKVANLIRERAYEELRKGLNSSMNYASSTLAHRSISHLSQPPVEYQHINEDLRDLMPPPPLMPQYPYYPPPK